MGIVSPSRRPPRFLPFILTGAVLGFLGALLFGLLAALLALLIDRRHDRA